MEPPGCSVDVTKEAELCCDLLDSPDLQACIRLLRDITQSAYGPHSQLKSIQNYSGGHLTLTSTSGRLFGALSVSKPVLKLVLGSVQRHTNIYCDGGLFAALLSLTLIDSSLRLPFQRHVIVDLYDCFLRMSMDYLKSPHCKCKYSVAAHSLDILLKLSKSILGAKPLCCLYGSKLDYISRLLVEAFLKSLPELRSQSCQPENIHLIAQSGFPVTDSKVFHGLLLDTCGRNISCVENINSSRLHNIGPAGNRCSLPVVVVDVSLSGDMEDFIEAEGYEMNCDVNVDEISTKRLLSFAEAVLQSGAKAVFCQKVVCPEVKMFLKRRGILVIDRLGGATCKSVQQLIGAAAISCVSASVHPSCVGNLTEITVETFHNKSYLLLKSASSQDVTLLLCNSQDEMVQELKAVSVGVIRSLYQHLDQPHLLAGGGCWQTHLAHQIRHQVLDEADTLMTEQHVSKSQLLGISDAFCHSLELCAMSLNKDGGGHMTDTANHHLWTRQSACWEQRSDDAPYTNCSCSELSKGETTHLTDLIPLPGSIKTSSSSTENYRNDDHSLTHIDKVTVFDSFSVQLNALRTAVLTACAVLGINQYIKDIN